MIPVTASWMLSALWSRIWYAPIALIGAYLIRNLFVFISHHLYSDLHAIPEPPLPIWKRYSIGHNLLYGMIAWDAFKTADLMNSWRRRCGSIYVFRIILGERGVMIMSKEGIRAVNISEASNLVKSDVTRAMLAPMTGRNGLLLAEGQKHARLRKAVAPSMHHDALTALGDIFMEQGKRLADQLAIIGESGNDIVEEVRKVTFAVIFQTCLGRDTVGEEITTKLREAYIESFSAPKWYTFKSVFIPLLFPFLDPMLFTYRRDLKQYIRNTIFKLCKQHKERCERGEKSAYSPLLSLMYDEDTKSTIPEQELMETVLTFVAAGQATTSLAVCWTLYSLARERQWQERVVKEMQDWSESDGLAGLDRLPILDRVVRESIRLYPPAFYVSRKAIKTVTIDGYRIPKGTILRIPILAVQRNAEIWGPDVNEFNPDRFLREGELARTRMFWCAFQFGPRGCIGQRFALLEIKAFVVQVLLKLDAYVKPLQDPAPRILGIMAKPTNMKIYFRKRHTAKTE